MNDERAQIRAEAVREIAREIADWLECQYPDSISADLVRKQWLKPDPPEELVKAFVSDTRDEGGSEIVRTPNTEWQFAHYTRWLIDTGRLRA